MPITARLVKPFSGWDRRQHSETGEQGGVKDEREKGKFKGLKSRDKEMSILNQRAENARWG